MMLCAILSAVTIAIAVIGGLYDHHRVAVLREKSDRYDAYCQQLKLSLRDYAKELHEAKPASRDELAVVLLDRLEARYSADDVMSCGTKAVDLKRYQECLGGPRSMTDVDRDCLVNILTAAETSIPAWTP
jgi:hypothetical protein